MWMVTVPVLLLLGMASGWFSGSGNRDPWFRSLRKPLFEPPSWAFPVVWTTLYILMGVALARVIEAPAGGARTLALVLFGVQFALNLAWSPLFFGAHRPREALGLMVALDIALVATIVAFVAVDGIAAALLLPYAVWLGIATALNAAIVRLNP